VEATVLWAGMESPSDVQRVNSLNKKLHRMIETAVP
jgi:hypothetical protein